MKTQKLIAAGVFTFLTLSQLALLAQAGPPGPGGSGPVDGGVVALLAGVAFYGYKKLKKNEIIDMQ